MVRSNAGSNSEYTITRDWYEETLGRELIFRALELDLRLLQLCSYSDTSI